MHKLVQIVRFESARKLPKVPEGHPCGNVYGLAFKLEVHVEGKVDPETYSVYIIDLKKHSKQSALRFRLLP